MSTGTPGIETFWGRGRFDQRSGPNKILFGRMYEDCAVESRVFNASNRILCIASAGCTAIELAKRHPVVAVDINLEQLEYARCRSRGGATVKGVAERVMAGGRTMAFMVGWSSRLLETFLDFDDLPQQVAFWKRHLDTLRFRLSFDRLMSIPLLRNVYAAPFLRFLPRHFGAVLRARMERCFSLHANRSNPYARALLLGEPLPADSFPAPAAIKFVHADVVDFLQQSPPGSFDGFTLSNVLDGASPRFQQQLIRALENAATPSAIVVTRSFREPIRKLSHNLAASDRSMLWGVVEALPLSNPSQLLRNLS